MYVDILYKRTPTLNFKSFGHSLKKFPLGRYVNYISYNVNKIAWSTHCVRAAPSIFCCECLFHCTMLLWTQSSVIDNSLLFKCSKSQQ